MNPSPARRFPESVRKRPEIGDRVSVRADVSLAESLRTIVGFEKGQPHQYPLITFVLDDGTTAMASTVTAWTLPDDH